MYKNFTNADFVTSPKYLYKYGHVNSMFQTTVGCFFNTGSIRKTNFAIWTARTFATSNIPEAFCPVSSRGNTADIMLPSWDTHLCQRLWYTSHPSPKSSRYSRDGTNSSTTWGTCHGWLQTSWHRPTTGALYRSCTGIWWIEPSSCRCRASATGGWARSGLVSTTSATSPCLHWTPGPPCTWSQPRT